MEQTSNKEWEVTISITRTMKYPVEDNEDAEAFKQWVKSLNGKRHIQSDFIKDLRCSSYPINADLEVVDIILKDGK